MDEVGIEPHAPQIPMTVSDDLPLSYSSLMREKGIEPIPSLHLKCCATLHHSRFETGRT